MVESHNCEVIVVGGGIGGLSAALSLARFGITTHILERKKSRSEDGAGIQIGPNGTKILRDLGILESLRPFAGAPSFLKAFDGRTGKIIATLPLGQWIFKRYESPYWVLHRLDLHRALFEAARDEPLVSITMDAHVCDIKTQPQIENGVRVSTQNGKAWHGGAVIGADGIWSQVRNHVLAHQAHDTSATASPVVTPSFTSKSAARTVISVSKLPLSIPRDSVTLWMAPNAHLVAYPIREGRDLALVVVVTDRTARKSWGSPIDESWILERMAGFDQSARLLVASGENWRVWGLHAFERLPTWVHGCVGLLGDAAHPILPFLAQGAVMALEDAVVLADCLKDIVSNDGKLNRSRVSTALLSYQTRRRPRVFRVQDRSMRQGEIYHMRGLMAHSRDLVLRYSPAARLMARYDWLYGWEK